MPPMSRRRLNGSWTLCQPRKRDRQVLLRAGLFVDLYAIVRHAIRASVESYSIKTFEPLYAFERTVGLPDVGSTALLLARSERSHAAPRKRLSTALPRSDTS